MITTAFLSLGVYILSWIVGLFPIGTGFPSQVTASFAWLGGYLQMLDPLVPIDTLGTTVSIILAVELIVFSWKGFNYLLSKMPFISK